MEFSLSGNGKDLIVNDRGVFISEKGISTFIPLRNIESVVIKEASALSGGYILFRTPGSYVGTQATKATDMEVAMDKQAVFFKKGSNEIALAIRDAIAEKLEL